MHMPRPRHIVALLAAVLVAASCRSAPTDEGEPPTLVVLMVVDQLSPTLLERYDDLFTGGFRRLLDDGRVFENATHDHANTYTAPGHVTLSTGVYPARHGVVGNNWSELRDGEWDSVYAVSEPDSPILGYPDLPGRGPENIERAGLPDWVLANDPEARAVSVSAKDRAAIGLMATAPGDVYWIERYGGTVVTSAHYDDSLPEWVADFNADELPALYSDTLWVSTVPEAAKSRSLPDTSRYELDREHTAFPHRPSDRGDPTNPRDVNNWRWTYTPFTDRAVAAFAKRAVEQLELGQRGHVDYLGVSFSAVDLVGHYYGPLSREQLDNLLRLDRELDSFLDFLDDDVGAGNWVLAFSADHGVLQDIPEQMVDDGVDAGRLGRGDRGEVLAALRESGTPQQAKAALQELPFAAAVYTFDEIESATPVDSFAVLYRNSHSTTRIVHMESRSGVYLRLLPNRLDIGSPQASHGSPYYYDRHVPLVFLGDRIASGNSSERVATVDVAPTLARLAGVPAPNDLDGRVLDAALPR